MPQEKKANPPELPTPEALIKPFAEVERTVYDTLVVAPAKAAGVTPPPALPGPFTLLLAVVTGKAETVLAPFIAPKKKSETKTEEEKEAERRGWGI